MRSLRVLIPLVVMLCFLVAMALSLFNGLESRRTSLLNQARMDCRQAVSHLAVAAEHGLAHDLNLLAEEAARLATDPRSKEAAVFDPRGLVLAASDTAWIGQQVSRLPSYGLAQFERARQVRMVVMAGDAEARVITAMMSFALPDQPGPRRGVAYVAFDLSQSLKEVHVQELAERLPELVVTLFTATLLVILLNRLVTRPLRRLESSVHAVAAGEFFSHMEDEKMTELRGLGDAFRMMRGELAERIAQAERLALRDEVLESLGEGVCGFDSRGRCAFINPAALAMLGWRAEEAIGMDRSALFRCSHVGCHAHETDTCPIGLTLKDGERRDVEDRLINAAGEPFPVNLVVTPIIREGATVGVVSAFQDISERKRIEAELHHLATTDPLTGVANRRRFLEQMEMQRERLKRYAEPAALLIIDIDHFKRVNDRHGHAAGDAVLRHISGLAQSLLRRNDLFGRLGGEEFGILLPETGLEGAREFAERFRQHVGANPTPRDPGGIPCTVSIGVTAFLANDDGPDRVLARADAALYRAKERGRDQVAVESV